MSRRANAMVQILCCMMVASLLTCPTAYAGVGDVQKKAASQAAPTASAPSVSQAPDAIQLGERVAALEKENIVLREDLGKSRLDARIRLSELEKARAEDAARFQQKVDALNAELAAEREKSTQRNRNLWIAIGVVALGVLATN